MTSAVVEAAVLLGCAAVLYLVWARSQRKGFHLPGGDGTVIMAAGGWVLALLIWRLFDKPSSGARATRSGSSGACRGDLAAGLLTAAGARVRAAHRPEPPNPAADDVEWWCGRRAPSAAYQGAPAGSRPRP